MVLSRKWGVRYTEVVGRLGGEARDCGLEVRTKKVELWWEWFDWPLKETLRPRWWEAGFGFAQRTDGRPPEVGAAIRDPGQMLSGRLKGSGWGS